MHDVVGWRCAVCGARTELTEPMPWRCPNSTLTDRHHVLQATSTRLAPPDETATSDNPFIRHDRRLAWAAAAAARGMTDAARAALVDGLDDRFGHRRLEGGLGRLPPGVVDLEGAEDHRDRHHDNRRTDTTRPRE